MTKYPSPGKDYNWLLNDSEISEETPPHKRLEEVLSENSRLQQEVERLKMHQEKSDKYIMDMKHERSRLIEKFHAMKKELAEVYQQYEKLKNQQQEEHKRAIEEKDKIIKTFKKTRKIGLIRTSRSASKARKSNKIKLEELSLTIVQLEKERAELGELLKTGNSDRECTYIKKMIERNAKKLQDVRCLQNKLIKKII